MRRTELPGRCGFRGALGAALLALMACAAGGPEDRVAALRSRYTASLNSFVVEETPREEAAPEAPSVAQDVLLDILIQSRADERLAGLTLDVTQVDKEKREKGRYRIWVDTSGVGKGRGESVFHRLQDIDYQEGDGFHVEVRHPVPLAERGLYREFGEGG
jgi:hypothetical protein